jgi:hypothetical protein
MTKNGTKNCCVFRVGVSTCCLLTLISFAAFSPEEAQAQKSVAAESAINRVQGGFMSTSNNPPLEVDLSSLPQATAQEFATHPQRKLRPLDGLTDAEYWAKKKLAREQALAGLTGAKSTALGAKYTPLAGTPMIDTGENGLRPPSVGAFEGFTAQQELCFGCNWPSDMALAVGTNFVVQVVNTQIAVYNKAGTLAPGFPKSADTFFGLASGTYTTDPRAFYDWANHRFVVVMLTESNPFNSNGPQNVGGLLIAASETQDPRGVWRVFSPAFKIGNTGECPDFPTLGHDSNNWAAGATKGGFYVGINEFGGTGICTGSGFIGNYFFMIANDGIYNGGTYSWWTATGFTHGGTLVDTMAPANMTDWADRPSSVLFANTLNISFGGGQNTLVVWSVSNPFGWISGGPAPVFTGINLTTAHTYDLPPAADEPGASPGTICGQCIDTGDKRISGQLKYHAGHLFGALETSVSGSGEAGPIWFDVHPILDTNGNITSAEEPQEDCFVCGGWANNGSAFYATLQPDPENNLVMVFSFSTDTAFPGLVYTSRRVNYGDSLMNGVGSYLIGGSAFYNQGCNSSGQFCRWGDYTATAPDLTVATRPSMWFSGQYANSSGNWGTAIGAARYLSPTDQ